jgi:hypothetical protein
MRRVVWASIATALSGSFAGSFAGTRQIPRDGLHKAEQENKKIGLSSFGALMGLSMVGMVRVKKLP